MIKLRKCDKNSHFINIFIFSLLSDFSISLCYCFTLKIQQSMRSEKQKLTQPSRLKSIPKFQLPIQPPLSETSQRSAIDEVDLIFLNKTKTAFDQTSFKTKYERALDLISKNKQYDSRHALTILEFLCAEIPKLPPHTTLTYELLQNVVTNTWRLKNYFKDNQPRRQQALIFIRNYVAFFAQSYRREQVYKNGLHMLYLIQANEQFDQKLYPDALKSCELSIKHCGSVKNQVHQLKVEYLKCNIHSALGNYRQEAESIRRSLFFINTLMASTVEQNLKDYVNQLKNNLLSREAYLKDNPALQKSLETKKTSFSLFRKRSLSHKRQNSQKQITIPAAQKKPENATNSLHNSKSIIKSIHTRSDNISKYNPSSKQERATFLPVDLTKFNRPQQKLKKKPLKISQRHRNNDFQESRSNFMDQIQKVAPAAFNYESLMVRRPNQLRKPFLKKSTKFGQTEQPAFEQVSINQDLMSKKESNRQPQQEKIQPVTHYIAKSIHTNDQVIEQEKQQLIRECVHLSEETLLKTFLRNFIQEEEQSQFNEKISANASNHTSRVDGSSSSEYSSQNQFNQNNEQPAQITVNRSETNTQFDFFQTDLDCDPNFNLNQNLQLVTYAGILSRFKFSIKIQKKQHLDQSEQLYKEIYISFCTIMNKIQWLHGTITFRYYNPFEKNLEIILYEICKNQLDSTQIREQSIKKMLLSLMANRLIIVRKPNGLALAQKYESLTKDNNLSTSYTQFLKNNFIIYQQNKLTNFHRNKIFQEIDYTAKRKKQNAFRLQLQDHPKENQEDFNAFHQILNYYLPKLIRRMTDDLKQQKSSISSIKRMKTERFYKDTILSFKSLIKSMNQTDNNARITFDDQKSLSLVMPSDFNSKVSNFFEHEEGAKETSIYQFYYCMKFILIQPSKIEKIEQTQTSQALTPRPQRRITIDKMVKQRQRQFQIVKPKYLEKTLQNFYDEIQVQNLFQLSGKWHAHIRMTCFKVKQVFKKTEQYFYKFEMQFKGERIKMMKFIATSSDIYLLVSRRNFQLKSSRKKEKILRDDYEIPSFNRFSLIALLKQISQRIFVKKDYIYSLIGLETISPDFSYINKFRLQGKTVQNKQFMIPHLKCIHILLQKSVKIICDHFREYAVLTIRHVQKCTEFNVIFYLPAYQRTFSINLNTSIIQYLTPEHKQILFDKETPLSSQQTLKILFSSYEESEIKPLQTILWDNFSKLFKFQVSYYEDKMHMLLKIGNYVAFLKDSCFSEFFQLKDKIFHLQMSLSRKSQLNYSEFQLKNARKVHPKRKSASNKELIKRNFLVAKDIKSSGRVLKPNIANKCTHNQQQLFRKGDLFERLNKVYQTETSKYIIYISLSKIYGIGDGQLVSQCEPHRVNLSFYLSDLITLLKESKKELYTKQEKIYNEFNEQVFSFAILLRSMTLIKYRIINELRRFRELDSLFVGENTISIQKQFKNTLTKAFCAQNDNLYSLNSSKKLYKLSNNIYLINKNLMPGKRNVIVSIFYDQKCKRVKFYLTNVGELSNKQKMYQMREMKFPWIELYQKEQLFKISPRIYNYYKNILLFT